MLLALLVALPNAERAWKEGVWAPRDGRTYVIETAREVITARPTGAQDPPLDAAPGTAVQFAIEDRRVYVRAGTTEHVLDLVASAPKYADTYGALGSGHYITAVAPGGTTVTLEDGSRWDVDPRQHFAVAGWQPDDLISVRRSTSDPDFAYEIDNTSQDDGAPANFRVR